MKRVVWHRWAFTAAGLYNIGWGSWTAFVLCLTNDVIWWAPFGLYLYDAWPLGAVSERPR